MSILKPITNVLCPRGRAGIRVMWATEAENVQDITFDNQGRISNISILEGTKWVQIDFEKNTAFFKQDKRRIGGKTEVTQRLTFAEQVMTYILRDSITSLNLACRLYVIVQDMMNQKHFCGLHVNEITKAWRPAYMRTGSGEANTGADWTTDSSEFKETLECKTNVYAPYFIGGELEVTINECVLIGVEDFALQDFLIDEEDNDKLINIPIQLEPAGSIASINTSQSDGELFEKTSAGIETKVFDMPWNNTESRYEPPSDYFLPKRQLVFRSSIDVILLSGQACNVAFEQIWSKPFGIGYDIIQLDQEIY